MHTRPQDSTVTPHSRTLPIISNLVINTKNVSNEIKIGLAAAANSSTSTLPQQPQFIDRLEPFMPPTPTEEAEPTTQDIPVVSSNIQEDIADSISSPSSEVVGQKRKRTEDSTEIELLDGAPPLKIPCLEDCSIAETVQEVEDSDSAIIRVTKEDFMCTLCRCLLYEPVSPRCGHTFCKKCIFEAISHNNHCPICRVIIHITPEAGVNSLIKDLIVRSFPGQYGKEQLEAQAEDEALASANPAADLVITIPIFPLEMVLFPYQLLPMQVFKPQYQLMLSRCLEGGGSFGVLFMINGVVSQVGTEAVVENHAQLPDGRSLISCRGARRFEVLETSEMEGYPIAKIRYIKDIEERAAEQNDGSSANDPSPSSPSPSSQSEVEELYKQMVELTRTKMGGVLPMIEQKFGPLPTNNVEHFSYWLACLLPFPLEKKQAYLQCRSVMERLRIGQDAFNRR